MSKVFVTPQTTAHQAPPSKGFSRQEYWSGVPLPPPLLELTPQKDVLFITGDWNAKVGSQEIPGVTGKFGLEYKMKQANRVLSRECTGHSKHPLPTTQEMNLYVEVTRWLILKSN